ncbi:MAG: hypothetical protein LC130_36135 [Bryobacterales bacterium]|nr:hypothetical protein [Bryobacterales bacterium]
MSDFLRRYIGPGDVLKPLSPEGCGVLIERSGRQLKTLLYTPIRYVTQPKPNKDGAGFLARVEIPESTDTSSALFLSGEALTRYFYGLDRGEARKSLYDYLGTPETATPADLRTAWRLRQLEFGTPAIDQVERVWMERSFNILAHPDLRNCYDVLRRDEDAQPVFPYGGFGFILVEGRLSADSGAFFADRILAYKPEMRARKASLLLRQCEFLTDLVICRDPRRRLEVFLDTSLLPGVNWDLTWNHWKRWLRTRINVDAVFVRTGKYRLRNGEWILQAWDVALPSRLQVTLPPGVATDVERARAIAALLGEHAEVVGRTRAEIENKPVEYVQVQEWFDRLGVSTHLKPQHVTWESDYEAYYFEQLRRRSTTWFLFRREYVFVWQKALVAEIPRPGHATYVFAKPADVQEFMHRYSCVSRPDIRRNARNVAIDLGFIGRVVRGNKKRRWLNDVLKIAGENADCTEVLD